MSVCWCYTNEESYIPLLSHYHTHNTTILSTPQYNGLRLMRSKAPRLPEIEFIYLHIFRQTCKVKRFVYLKTVNHRQNQKQNLRLLILALQLYIVGFGVNSITCKRKRNYIKGNVKLKVLQDCHDIIAWFSTEI